MKMSSFITSVTLYLFLLIFFQSRANRILFIIFVEEKGGYHMKMMKVDMKLKSEEQTSERRLIDREIMQIYYFFVLFFFLYVDMCVALLLRINCWIRLLLLRMFARPFDMLEMPQYLTTQSQILCQYGR